MSAWSDRTLLTVAHQAEEDTIATIASVLEELSGRADVGQHTREVLSMIAVKVRAMPRGYPMPDAFPSGLH